MLRTRGCGLLYAVWMFSIFSSSQVYIIINNIIALWLHIFSKLVKFGCLQMYSTQSDVGARPTDRQRPEAGSVNALCLIDRWFNLLRFTSSFHLGKGRRKALTKEKRNLQSDGTESDKFDAVSELSCARCECQNCREKSATFLQVKLL